MTWYREVTGVPDGNDSGVMFLVEKSRLPTRGWEVGEGRYVTKFVRTPDISIKFEKVIATPSHG